MKFTKEQAVKELAAKYKPRYGEPAQWERTITESVEHAMKLIGEESEIELDAFVGSVIPFLDTTAGMVLKETSTVANPLNQQIEDLKRQIADKKTEGQQADGELLKRLEALEQASAESKRLETIAAKRTEIAAKLKEKGAKDAAKVELMLQMANVTADTDTDAESTKYLEIYNKMFAGAGDGSTPGNPDGGKQSERVKSVIERAAQIAKDRIA